MKFTIVKKNGLDNRVVLKINHTQNDTLIIAFYWLGAKQEILCVSNPFRDTAEHRYIIMIL